MAGTPCGEFTEPHPFWSFRPKVSGASFLVRRESLRKLGGNVQNSPFQNMDATSVQRPPSERRPVKKFRNTILALESPENLRGERPSLNSVDHLFQSSQPSSLPFKKLGQRLRESYERKRNIIREAENRQMEHDIGLSFDRIARADWADWAD